eukprot:1067163-Prorocentrum_minimum.AAC.2
MQTTLRAMVLTPFHCHGCASGQAAFMTYGNTIVFCLNFRDRHTCCSRYSDEHKSVSGPQKTVVPQHANITCKPPNRDASCRAAETLELRVQNFERLIRTNQKRGI